MDFLGKLFLYCVSMQVLCSPVFSVEWEADVLLKIEALTGSCVVVPCRFRYPGGQKPSSSLSGLWLINIRPEKYIYADDKVNIIDSFKGRTRLLGNLGQYNCTLEIDDVKDHDIGPYCFRIEIPTVGKFTFGKQCVSITSTDIPEKPKLTYAEKSFEGQPYTITCSVTHTCPSHMPVLTWSRTSDSEIITLYNSHGSGVWEVQSILTFIPHAIDDDSDITCEAKFHGGKSSESKMSLRVKRKMDMLSVIIPVTVMAITAAIFGGLCFLIRKKYICISSQASY